MHLTNNNASHCTSVKIKTMINFFKYFNFQEATERKLRVLGSYQGLQSPLQGNGGTDGRVLSAAHEGDSLDL